MAREALKGRRTINAIAAHDGVPPTQVAPSKRQAWAARPALFSDRRARTALDEEPWNAQRYQPIGPRKIERDGRTKTAGLLG